MQQVMCVIQPLVIWEQFNLAASLLLRNLGQLLYCGDLTGVDRSHPILSIHHYGHRLTKRYALPLWAGEQGSAVALLVEVKATIGSP